MLFVSRAMTLIIVLFAMLGCRQYNLYQYQPVSVATSTGEIKILLQGSYGESYESNGKKQADLGAPYFIIIAVEVPQDYELSGFAIRNIEWIDETTNQVIEISDTSSDKANNTDNATWTSILVAKRFDSLPYNSYRLRANAYLSSNNRSDEKIPIDVVLRTDFAISRRWDWFDRLMSV